jgi:hypothetical protein
MNRKTIDSFRISRKFGRGGAIRTPDPLRPRQVRYQAALRPDICWSFDSKTLLNRTSIPKSALSLKTYQNCIKTPLTAPWPYQNASPRWRTG